MSKKNGFKETHPLRELRTSLGLSQDEIGFALGLTRGRISQVETGDGYLSGASVISVMDEYRSDLNKLGITAEDLLRGTRRRT